MVDAGVDDNNQTKRGIGEDRAASAGVLLPKAERLIELVRDGFANATCQLTWTERTYGRVFSLAALGHECVVLEQLASGVRQEFPSSIMALLARHHFETWLTGMYLFFGGDVALEAFLGESQRSHEALRQEIEKVHANGVALDVALPPLEEFEWEAARWKYERAAQELDRLGSESGLLHNALAMYQVVYRALSGTHGAHPTHRLLDTYVDASSMFARVLPRSQSVPLRRALLQGSLVLSAMHALFSFAERGLPTDEFARLVNELRPSSNEDISTSPG
ncbi:MAG: hypothetical protein M0Z82_08520 [Actinomycetota bacterium]|jgi:hypothetical protein|nr:hypothetical protein [Actinomycetota bacterium]